MIPYRDNIPCRYTPWMTWSLIAVNTMLFLGIQYGLEAAPRNALFQLYGLVPARFTHPDWAVLIGFPPGDYSAFVSSLFLHSGWLHLVLNLWLLWIFGDNVEDRMGAVRFLLFYLACGLLAGALHIFFNVNSAIPTVGASGAIAGIMGAFYFLYPQARVVLWIPVFLLPLFVEVPAIAFVGLWVIIQMYKATTFDPTIHPYADVAWWGHIGGFIAGMLLHPLFLASERDPLLLE
ncbi:MAG: rhomboid family intramembrane serine protease [Methylococcaceae bacterium]|nr:MAG: rhomboid family intramembrane serine protease [Methylococcaceae bacterium]